MATRLQGVRLAILACVLTSMNPLALSARPIGHGAVVAPAQPGTPLHRVQASPQQPPRACDDPRFASMLLGAFNDFRPNAKEKAVSIENVTTITWDAPHTVFTCHAMFRLSDNVTLRGRIGIHLDARGQTIVTWDRD